MGKLKLVTGGSGFFGWHLVQRLLRHGDQVRVLDVNQLPEARKGVEFVQASVLDENAMLNAAKGASCVYHCAALLPFAKAGSAYFRVNVDGTRNALNAARNAGVPKFVFLSSSAVYGSVMEMPITEETQRRPYGKYGESKLEAEKVCEAYRRRGMDVSIIRPRTTVGQGRLGIFQILFEWVREGRKVYILGSGNNLFQMVSARDLAEACVLAERKGPFEDFNIGAEKYSTLKNDLEALIRHANSRSRVISVNPIVAKTALRLLDKLGISPLVDYHYHIYDKSVYFDVTKAKRFLGWRARESNTQMLIHAYEWYLKNLDKLSFGSTHRNIPKQGVLEILKWLS